MRIIGAALLFPLLLAAQMPQQIAGHLTADALKADVSFLASDALQGRGTPSPGLDIAAEFIASQFRRSGLEPAGDDGYFQTAQYKNVTPSAEPVVLTTNDAKANPAMISVQDPVALDLTEVAITRATADIATLTAFTVDQVRGRAMVLDLPAPAQTAGGGRGGAMAVFRLLPILTKLKPAAILILSATPGITTRIARLRDASADVTPVITVWDPDFRASLNAKPAGLSIHIPAPTEAPVKLRNVLGALRGSDPRLKDTYLLLTAHYDHLGVRENSPGDDHIFNGANDDASGTASVIEIAHALALLPQHPKRTIVFMTQYGEELGDLGSRYYAQHPVFPLARTIADINLEQLGRTDDTRGPQVGMLNLTGFDYTNIPASLSKAADTVGIRVVNDEKNSGPYFTRSDNAAFAAAGVPSTTLAVAYDFPDYHKAGDEWPKLDYDNMAKVDLAIALAALDLANSDSVPEWNAANPATARFIKAREEGTK
ncbi:MAG TPA: M28 family peptidase [Bryobacteraceae bacterium]|nr:M28 family peptidase [Bryobacteraceae bacterium]